MGLFKNTLKYHYSAANIEVIVLAMENIYPNCMTTRFIEEIIKLLYDEYYFDNLCDSNDLQMVSLVSSLSSILCIEKVDWRAMNEDINEKFMKMIQMILNPCNISMTTLMKNC